MNIKIIKLKFDILSYINSFYVKMLKISSIEILSNSFLVAKLKR